MSNKKIIAVVGSTGNQGGSVAETFLALPEWHVRGLTRDPTKPSASTWKEKGVELVSGDLNSVESLTGAFSGANVIFGTTDFWGHMQDPSVQEEAKTRGITPNEVSYEREVQQAKNIVDAAAANIATLDRFVMSAINDSKYWSKGKITFNLHFESKWRAIEYLQEKYPALWEKTSLLQVGFYASNWKTTGVSLPKKTDKDGEYVLSMPMGGDSKVAIVDVNGDTGNFVKALVALPPKVNLIGAGSKISWKEYAAIWGQVNNVSVSFTSYPASVLEEQMGSAGKELGEMFTYIDEFGYDGGDPSVIYPWEVKEKYGIDVKYTTMEEYIAKQDYSAYL
ncbi:NAD(P)-binding protein [Periconia macrospinosa]|uniref:NAD(P)-binding protein n=1 Tax=Periconia macrospinosa TaxID=97972 RepID=A0A2V1E745_9PLEO|nr:NAD(P)-binding protein [Periconia macrospinosa]